MPRPPEAEPREARRGAQSPKEAGTVVWGLYGVWSEQNTSPHAATKTLGPVAAGIRKIA